MEDETMTMEPSGRVLPIFRGEYSDTVVYVNPDIVLYENSSYVAKQTTIGNPPPKNALSNDYWQMVAKGIIDADISESTIEFTEASERSNIKSGEKSTVIMGKISKFFSDLKTVAFTGKYSDLTGRLTVSNSAAVTQTGQMALDAIEKNAAVSGTLANQIAQQNSNLTRKTANTNINPLFRQFSDGNYAYYNSYMLEVGVKVSVPADITFGWHEILTFADAPSIQHHMFRANVGANLRDASISGSALYAYLENADAGKTLDIKFTGFI